MKKISLKEVESGQFAAQSHDSGNFPPSGEKGWGTPSAEFPPSGEKGWGTPSTEFPPSGEKGWDSA